MSDAALDRAAPALLRLVEAARAKAAGATQPAGEGKSAHDPSSAISREVA